MNETAYPLAPQRRDRTATSEQKGMQVNDRHRHVKAMGLLLLACLTGMTFFAATAGAQLTRVEEPFSPFDASNSGATFHQLSGIAVDEATGNVFATDGLNSGEEAEGVVILGGEGGVPVGLAPPFKIFIPFTGNTPEGLVFDNSESSPGYGTLYAYDLTTEGIKKYRRNAETETYELTGEIPVPGTGNGTGMGIDAQGNVYIGSGASIIKFAPSGIQLAAYDLSETPISAPGQIAVDAAGDLFVGSSFQGVYKFPADISGEIDPAVYTKVATGGNGVAYNPTNNSIVVSTVPAALEFDATSLEQVGRFGVGVLDVRVERVAYDASTERVYIADYSDNVIAVFGPTVVVPTTKTFAATEVTGTKANLNGSVDPEGLPVTACYFEYGPTSAYGSTVPCEGSLPADSEQHPVSAQVSGLTPNGATYHFRLVTENENGVELGPDKTLTTAATVVTEPATGITTGSATLRGSLRPEGQTPTDCVFEYKPTTATSYEAISCTPPANQIEPDFAAHAVTAAVSGLDPNTTYEVRLKVTSAEGSRFGGTVTFTTTGAPQFTEVRARDATQSSAVLEGKINPSGTATSYHFEWGATAGYGNAVPIDFDAFVGSGNEPVRVTAKLTGLASAATYHYRIVAKNAAGTSATPDRLVETLNSCGLADNRCFELVSPRDPGPVAQPGTFTSNINLHYQAATSGPSSLAYTVEGGLPDATRGAEVLYRSDRGDGLSGWTAQQVSPPIVDQNERGGATANPNRTLAMSPDLSCSVVATGQPLTDDASARRMIEAGGSNLYRSNPDGSYDLITYLPPLSLAPVKPNNELLEYGLVDMADDCSTVVFETEFTYAGIPGAGSTRLYEYSEGTLRNVGFVPDGSGESPVAAIGGKANDHYNAVSADGSRVFFTADRLVAGNPSAPEEVGSAGIFVREDGEITRDVSATETGTPDLGASYQAATPDGSRVYFIANAGLTEESSPSGSDLYEYDLETNSLTDLSAHPEAGGADVSGVLAVADDGSHVYFSARGQLDPGRGPTRDENVADNTYSVYDRSAASVRFVGVVAAGDLGGSTGSVALSGTPSGEGGQHTWTSRTTPSGDALAFASSASFTGYDNAGKRMAYLYRADAAGETVCLTCRPDGEPPVTIYGVISPLQFGDNSNPNYAPSSLVELDGEPVAYFVSEDALASGAREKEFALYQWAHDQVTLVAQEPQGLRAGQGDESNITFVGASADGQDVYFLSPNALNWENPEGRPAAWDARVGGGFPEPPPAPAPCDPTVEGGCQGSGAPPPTVPSALTPGFVGPGNVPETAPKKQHKKKKHRHKRKHQKGKRGSKQTGKKSKRDGGSVRHAINDRRAGK